MCINELQYELISKVKPPKSDIYDHTQVFL